MIKYVCGFMLGYEVTNVALIRKTKPEWQKGKLNGIGGKIEEGESPAEAMCREFKEETGFETSQYNWSQYCVLSGDDYVVYFFCTWGSLTELKTTTEEEVVIIDIDKLTDTNCIPNLLWLIPMAKSLHLENGAISYEISRIDHLCRIHG